MNNRPIVVPGAILGIIVLSLLTVFAVLPEDPAKAASGKISDEKIVQIQLCRQWPTAAESIGLTESLAGLEKQLATGKLADAALQTQVATAAQEGSRMLNQVAEAPEIGKLAGDFKGLAAAFDALTQPSTSLDAARAALRTVRTHERNFEATCTEVDVAMTPAAS